MTDTLPRLLEHGVRDTRWMLRELSAIKAEQSLLDFIELFWKVLHPSRKLKRGRVLEVLCEHLAAVAQGRIKRLLINIPPGTGKSIIVDSYFPAWLWGPQRREAMQFCSWSYAEVLTVRNNRRFRKIIQDRDYRELYPHVVLAGDQNEKKLITNSAEGFKFAAGIHGTGTGQRGDILIVDDPHPIRDTESEKRRVSAVEWGFETLPSRTNDEHTATIGIMQRVHAHDFSGKILEKALGWDHLCLPMRFEKKHPFPSKTALGFTDWRTKEGELLFPERFGEPQVAALEADLSAVGGSSAKAGQLQQRPTPKGGALFKREWFEIIDTAPECVQVCRGWDLAATSSKENPDAAYTACVKLGRTPDGRFVILDVVRIQGSDFEVQTLLKATARQDGALVPQDLPQDPGQAGKTQPRQFAAMLAGFEVHFSPESGDKVDRARPFAAQCEAGNVLMVRAPWNDAYLAEAEVFDKGYKDQIDATSRSFSRLLVMAGGPLDVVEPELHEIDDDDDALLGEAW